MNILDLDAPLGGMVIEAPGAETAAVSNDSSLTDLSYRLSYSSQGLLHTCPRKYELYKLGVARSTEEDISTSLTFQYGHTVGTGLQELLITKDLDFVIWSAFLGWNLDLLVENRYQNKDFCEALYSLQVFDGMLKAGFLADYQVFEYNGKPAAEFSFEITFPPTQYTYIGFVDLVLQHIVTGELLVLEAKTTSAVYVKPEQYKNSGQAIGYSIVLDHLAPGASSYKVLYLPYLTKSRKYEPLEFTKLFSERARWITELLLDIDMLELYKSRELFPMHGESCLHFGKPCQYFGICTLDNSRLQKVAVPDRKKYGDKPVDVVVSIQELIHSQLERV